MPGRETSRAHAASATPLLAVLAALAALGVWFAAGALTQPEPAGYLVVPRVAADDVAPASQSQQAPDGTGGSTQTLPGNADLVDPSWAVRTADATGIPLRVLRGYAGAEVAMRAEAPGCGIRWSTLAALGGIESAHGTHAGSAVGADGVARPGIYGIDLTGASSVRIEDTDGGARDGKAGVDRAVGPLQFIPATWETWGADGNGDGASDPQQIDDASLAAARYLCHYGDLTHPEAWRRAVFAYNHLDSYVDDVARAAVAYAERSGR